jgi:methanethiol oxidase
MQDPTFYRSPAEAIAAPPERLAYVAAYDPDGQARDAIAVLDCDPASADYGQVVGWAELPTAGNELHHFGWNACSSALCHQGHGGPLERRYLIVPGIRSSRIHVLDTRPDPRQPTLVRTIEAEELAAKAGYSRPHTVHCGPGGIFLFNLGGAGGNDGPGGIALLDHQTFDVIGPWEADRGDQFFGYDGWWHLDHDTVITSEWGTPSMIEDGLNPEDLLGRRFGHHLNFWSMSDRKLTQRVDLGDEHQMVLELRPAHDPAKAWGFVGVVISVEDLSGSVWLWHRDADRWAATNRTGSGPGRPSSTPAPRTAAGSAPTPGSSPTATPSGACGSTRPAWRAAMPPATPTATPADHATPGPPRRRAGAPAPAPARRRLAPAGGRRRPVPARRRGRSAQNGGFPGSAA